MGLNAFAKRYSGAVARDFDEAAGDGVADFVFGDELVQACWGGLLDAQAELTLFFVEVEDFGFDDLAGAEDVLRAFDALFGADLADVDHAFYAFG